MIWFFGVKDIPNIDGIILSLKTLQNVPRQVSRWTDGIESAGGKARRKVGYLRNVFLARLKRVAIMEGSSER
jgi:hypothetical protein